MQPRNRADRSSLFSEVMQPGKGTELSRRNPMSPSKFLLLALFILFAAILPASEQIPSISFAGPCYFRLPGFRSFVLQHDFSEVPVDTLVTVRPDVNNPLATDSRLLVGSYTVTMLPGAVLKISARGFVPLTGRFVFAGEGDRAIVFASRAYELYYKSGRLLLEVTPDDGTFIVLRGKGDAFVKGLNRRIYDLEAGQEIHFPLFGEAKLRNRPGGFWNDPPTGFSSARRQPDSVPLSEDDTQAPEDTKDTAENESSEEIEDSEENEKTDVIEDNEDT